VKGELAVQKLPERAALLPVQTLGELFNQG
jgi:hypothetical protein